MVKRTSCLASTEGFRVQILVGVLACVECNKHKADRTPAQAKMKLRKQPIRPTWKPLYADLPVRIESWSKFLYEAYWNVKLEA